MPLGSNASKNIEELYAKHKGSKDWPRRRIIAAALNAARDAGGRMPPERGFKQRKRRGG
jgi:hypothetical protein